MFRGRDKADRTKKQKLTPFEEKEVGYSIQKTKKYARKKFDDFGMRNGELKCQGRGFSRENLDVVPAEVGT